MPFVARGAGTGLSGGAMPVADGVVISVQKLRRILEIDVENRRAVLEPGVYNLEISKAAAPHGLYYAPDPSSQQVCTIGGNVAENSGGAHCLKYGFTTNHVLEMEVVLADGSVVTLGGPTGEQAGPDLRGVFIGSEGTLGVCTKVTVRLLQTPQAVRTVLADFPSIEAAGDTVGDIVDAAIIPAAVEMMDSLAMEAAEAATGAGCTVDAPAALIIELDGPPTRSRPSSSSSRPSASATAPRGMHVPQEAEERQKVWKGRKAAFAAVGRISPDYIVQDGVVPRTRLCRGAHAHRRHGPRRRPARRQRLPRGRRQPPSAGALLGGRRRARRGREALHRHRRAVRRARRVALGRARHRHRQGVLDAERCSPRTTSPSCTACASRFDPDSRCNPGKLFPTPRLCGERPGKYQPHPLEEAGVIERL